MKLQSILNFFVRQGTCYGGGGGGPTNTTTTVNNIPAYLEPFITRNVQAAEGATNVNYTPYTGSRLAGFNQNQAQVQGGIMGMQTPGQFNPANAATANVMGASWANPDTAQAFMNPYQQNVTDIQKREAMRQSDIQGVSSDAQFAKAGAFGGSRQGIVDAERQRNLGQQMNDIQQQGSSQAYQQGMGQFNAQQGQRLGAAQQLAGLGTAEQQANLSRFGAQAGVGQQQQQLAQQQADIGYGQFKEQRDFKKDQLNWMAGLIHGTPYQAGQTQQNFAAAPNQNAQLAGLGLAGLGAYNASNQ